MPITQTVLEAHRANLASAETFEQYKEKQLEFIDFLIEDAKAEQAIKDVEVQYLAKVRYFDDNRQQWVERVMDTSKNLTTEQPAANPHFPTDPPDAKT